VTTFPRLLEFRFSSAGGASPRSPLEASAVAAFFFLGAGLDAFVFGAGLDAFVFGGGGDSSASCSGVVGLLVVVETREEAVTVCETLEVMETET